MTTSNSRIRTSAEVKAFFEGAEHVLKILDSSVAETRAILLFDAIKGVRQIIAIAKAATLVADDTPTTTINYPPGVR